ncbi:MAG: hypothetical protein LBJ31_06325 [Treponema sp.]|jgi:hypothetical protein|nr:hypothetical protein [Treponema sp.]
MSVDEVRKNSERLLPVNSVTRFSDSIFDIITKYKNFVVDGKFIRPVPIFENIKNEQQLYSENIAFYFIYNRLVAINIYHMDLNKNAINRDDIVKIYGESIKYQWRTENNDGNNILELFTNDTNRYIVLQSITQEVYENTGTKDDNTRRIVKTTVTLKHLTFVDRKWIDEVLKLHFNNYNQTRMEDAQRLLN